MNVLDMTISRVSRISMALSLMLLASWVWFNFLTQPQTMNLFVKSPSMFQKVSLGNLRLPGTDVLQNGFDVSQLPQLPGVEVIDNDASANRSLGGLSPLSQPIQQQQLGQSLGQPLGQSQALGQSSVTNFADAEVQGGPAPLLPTAQRQNIEIADLPFLVDAPPEVLDDSGQIVIAAPTSRLTVNPFAPIYVEEDDTLQSRTPVVNNNNNSPANNQSASRNSSQDAALAESEEEVVQPKIEIGAVPTPRPLLPPPSRQSNLPASLSTASLANNPSLLRAPIRAGYYDPSDIPEPVEPVVIDVPARVVEVAMVPEVVEQVVEEPEPVTLDRARLTGIRMPVAGASSSSTSALSSRAYNTNNGANALPSVTQAPARPTVSARLPQTAGVRAAVSGNGGTSALQPIGLKQAQLIGRRNVPVVEAPEPVIEEIVAPPVPQLRPVQIALRVPEPVAPVVQAPVVQAPAPVIPEPVIPEPVVQAPVVQEPVVEEVQLPEPEPVVEEPVVEEPVVEEPVVEEVDVVDVPSREPLQRSQPYIASVSSTLDLAEPVVDTTTIQAVATDTDSTQTAATDVEGASVPSVVANYVEDNNIQFTGAILGPVSVAIFKGRMGSFHVPIGENIPDTDIRLTNVKRHEVELRQGSENHIIYLDLGQ